MYERKHQRPIGHREFRLRVVRQFVLAFALVVGALGIGVLGYHWFAGLGWVDSLLDASMILGGMGPVHELESDSAKVFASMYALFSGLMFIGVTGFVLAPFLHRMMHRFHFNDGAE